MASPFSLSKKGKEGVGRAEYQKLLERETKRYGGDRDRAVRSANVAAGYGSSTAERFKGGGGGATAKPTGGGGGGRKPGGGPTQHPKKKTDRTKTSSTNAPLLEDRATRDRSSPIPIPTPRPNDAGLANPALQGVPPDLNLPQMPPAINGLPLELNQPKMPPPIMGVPADLRGTPQGPPMPPALGGMPPDLAYRPQGMPQPDPARFGGTPGDPVVGSGQPVVGSGNSDRRNFFARLLGLGG